MSFTRSLPYTNFYELIEYGREWERYLVDDKCEETPFGAMTPKFRSLTKPIVELAANICKEFKFHPEIEFTIYNTVDVFFVKYFITLRKKIEIIKDPAEANRKWQSMLSQIREELLIKIFNVSMICAKYVDSYTPIPLEKMVTTLQKSGCQVDVDAVKKSEYEVFRLIEFQISTPIAFHVIHFLVQKMYKGEPFRTLLEACILLLRFIYFERELIFQSLKCQDNMDLNNLEANERFLAGGVILCGATLTKIEENDYAKIVEVLLNYCKFPKHKLFYFADTLFRLIIK